MYGASGRPLRDKRLTASDIFMISFCYTLPARCVGRVNGGLRMNMLARNGGLWIAVGTAAGTAVGMVLGIASVGLALGLALGILAGFLARR